VTILDAVNDKGESVRITIDGETAKAIYSDTLAPVFDALGDVEIRRASHVEPATSIGWESDGWIADMRPMGGGILYESIVNGVKQPFKTRAAALGAELANLRSEHGL
jgi:hypothetical protein